MRQSIAVMMMCGVLSGCAAPNDQSWWEGWGALSSAGEAYEFDFAWALAGSERVAPLQVFSNAQQLWLQFSSDAQLPMLFVLRDSVLLPIAVRKQGIYHVVNDKVGIVLLHSGKEYVWAYREAVAEELAAYLRKHGNSIVDTVTSDQ